MERMDKGVDRAADSLGEYRSQRLTGRLGIKFPGKKVYFSGSTKLNWENNEILIQTRTHFFPFAELQPPKPSDHKICNTVRQFFLGELTGNNWLFSILTPPSAPSPKELAAAVHGAIRHWFSHVGYQSTLRDKELEAKLARMFFVEATVIGDVGGNRSRGVICKARFTEWDAPSKPWVSKLRGSASQ
ncbi:MAG: hypothetical protein OYG32_14250 [Rhodospirillaceae bacterium]|nr:hypothetical protein [Rhodospirillaceae bacterium]MDE0255949.1 hypothetical protein [Rhodospirillaceae bacterium]MDE0616002.1 hypothetical protein [Rhodospirillaceae bacterium]